MPLPVHANGETDIICGTRDTIKSLSTRHFKLEYFNKIGILGPAVNVYRPTFP